jgi:hypothetical protein
MKRDIKILKLISEALLHAGTDYVSIGSEHDGYIYVYIGNNIYRSAQIYRDFNESEWEKVKYIPLENDEE